MSDDPSARIDGVMLGFPDFSDSRFRAIWFCFVGLERDRPDVTETGLESHAIMAPSTSAAASSRWKLRSASEERCGV